jgi:hypothetical protein
MKIECPNCKQDWLHLVSHPEFSHDLFWCPEDDCLWFTKENIFKKQLFGVTFIRWQSYENLIGKTDFWDLAVDKGVYEHQET